MSRSPPIDRDEIREEIDLNQAIFESLVGQEDSEAGITRDRISQKLKDLRAKLDRMQPSFLPYWGYSESEQQPARNSQQSFDGSGSAYSGHSIHSASNQHDIYSPSTLELPSRKRVLFDAEQGLPSSKSQKSTPIHTPGGPSLDDTGYGHSDNNPIDDFDEFERVFGGDWPEALQNEKEYFENLENRKTQEQEDAEFARKLQEQWAQDSGVATASRPPTTNTSNYNQSFMAPNGSWQKPSASTLSRDKPDVKPQVQTIPMSIPLTDSSDEFEEVSAFEWNQRHGITHPQNNVLPRAGSRSFGPMPGAFPGQLFNPYASSGGQSVYDNNDFTVSGSNINWTTGQQPDGYSSDGFHMPGTAGQPYDLDAFSSLDGPPRHPLFSDFQDSSKTQEELKDLLKHIRPDEELSAEQLKGTQPDALAARLLPHQQKGLAWMKSMEEGSNKGGILGDDMGLGKTLQALCIVLDRPPEPDKHRPTLIVAPVALMQQWQREIKKFVKQAYALSVLILHGENRNKPWNFIRDYDVVLTTYGTLSSELKRKIVWDKHVRAVPDARPTASQELPLLGERSHFHRVILDEAQNIKNRSTKSAAAACQLRADYRWCLSGTPMQNNVDEIYSLIKFCRIRPYNNYDRFAQDIGRPLKRTTDWGKEKAMKQLQAILKAICLRRTKQSKIDGQPVLQLPEKITVEDRAPFSPDENEFYKQLESQAQIQFNRFLKNGTVGRHYSHALVLLLRLRQCCCSPQLVTNAKDFMTNSLEQVVEDRIGNARSLPADAVRRLDDNDAFDCPICMDAVENPVIFNPCGHTLCNECLAAMTEKALRDSTAGLSCPNCRASVDPHKCTDLESFLRVFHPEREGVEPLDGKEEEEEEDDTSDSDSDSSEDDRETNEKDDGEDLKDFIVDDDEEVEYDTDTGEPMKKTVLDLVMSKGKDKDIGSPAKKTKKRKSDSRSRSKGKGKAKEKSISLAELRKEGLKNKAAKKRYIRRLSKGYEPSAKIEKTIELLRHIKDRGQGEKTIIFSSFTSFLDLLEVALNRCDDLTNYTRFDGSMKASDRNDAVLRFTDNEHCKIILVSLKAGNAGLNLTAANHVIILDPFWNPFVEYQAADRCYRIGQQREVTIHRVLIGDPEAPDDRAESDLTVEDRILRLQDKKKRLVETALDENAASSLGRLTTRDLGYLFGVNSMD